MPPRLRSLHDHAETFARAATGLAPGADGAAAFREAWDLGVSGADCPVWLTADGQPVLSEHDAVGPRLRRRAIRSFARDQLPPSVVGLDDVLSRTPDGGRQLLLDVADDATLDAVLAVVRSHHPEAESMLWLSSPVLADLVSWRLRTSARLVNAVRLGSLEVSAEQWMNQLAERAVDALCLHHAEWSGGLIALAHRFGRLALARGAEHEREVASALDTGIDGVSSPHPDRLVAVAALYYPARYPSSS